MSTVLTHLFIIPSYAHTKTKNCKNSYNKKMKREKSEALPDKHDAPSTNRNVKAMSGREDSH